MAQSGRFKLFDAEELSFKSVYLCLERVKVVERTAENVVNELLDNFWQERRWTYFIAVVVRVPSE